MYSGHSLIACAFRIPSGRSKSFSHHVQCTRNTIGPSGCTLRVSHDVCVASARSKYSASPSVLTMVWNATRRSTSVTRSVDPHCGHSTSVIAAIQRILEVVARLIVLVVQYADLTRHVSDIHVDHAAR